MAHEAGKISLLHDYTAGAIAGMGSIAVGHPLDTIKVQLQTQQQLGIAYSGTWDAAKSIFQHGLMRGFFRGLSFPLVTSAAVNSVYFGVYGGVIDHLRSFSAASATSLTPASKATTSSGNGKKTSDQTATAPPYSHVFLAGCAGGLAQALILCPAEFVKVVLQSQIPHRVTHGTRSESIQSANRYFRGPIEAAVFVYKRQGVRGLFRGFPALLCRDVPTYGVYIVVYESMFRQLADSRYTDSHGFTASMVAGGFAGMTAWALCMPFDVIKSLIQADFDGVKYRGSIDCARQLYRSRGFGGFFVGLRVVCMRAFPVCGVTFLLYSQSLKYLNERRWSVDYAASSSAMTSSAIES